MILAAAAVAMTIGAAHAVDHLQMKEGLWRIRAQTIGNPGNKKSEGTVTLCRDHAFDSNAEARAREIKGCNPMTENFANGKYSSEMNCKVGNITIASKEVATFSADTSVHSETHVTYTPALAGTTDETMIQDQTYLGACPAGMRPGDRWH
jgi:hypothetical protein